VILWPPSRRRAQYPNNLPGAGQTVGVYGTKNTSLIVVDPIRVMIFDHGIPMLVYRIVSNIRVKPWLTFFAILTLSKNGANGCSARSQKGQWGSNLFGRRRIDADPVVPSASHARVVGPKHASN
jgi:hypothetical protein